MEILCLKGTDRRLYELVAPLVMSPAVIRQNNNYPFKTSFRHTWYVAVEDDTVVGFMPLKAVASGLYIDNYYIQGDDENIIGLLLDNIVKDNDVGLTALVHKRHVEAFGRNHFRVRSEWKNYDKMFYDLNDATT